MYSLIVTAKMNDVDPLAWLADVLAWMSGIVVSRLPRTPLLELESRPNRESRLIAAQAGCLRSSGGSDRFRRIAPVASLLLRAPPEIHTCQGGAAALELCF